MYRIDVYKDATSPAIIARLYVNQSEIMTAAESFKGYYITASRI